MERILYLARLLQGFGEGVYRREAPVRVLLKRSQHYLLNGR
jgi:hypothetical protein